ncbi:probable serine/threonine-protein kinase fhkB [Mycetomoellerius zeteki]|uniref:probable serine/threonine-protein kinase fhkB n=1 Tax=Mycetomoellerius zeteki TaxID=64791 RepID=UPI00084E68BF|nr:PREDICTED: probable serine/threonine-protein kinase fhkB [Trachymyrmex zeteki]
MEISSKIETNSFIIELHTAAKSSKLLAPDLQLPPAWTVHQQQQQQQQQIASAVPAAIQSTVNCAELMLARRRTSDLHASSQPVGGTDIIWQADNDDEEGYDYDSDDDDDDDNDDDHDNVDDDDEDDDDSKVPFN